MQTPGAACFAALAEFTTDAVMLVSGDGVILWASPSSRDVLGFPPETLVGTQPRDLVMADDQDAYRALIDQALARPGAAVSGAFRCRHSDGSLRWTHSLGRNLLDEPSIGAILVCFRDVTAAHEVEAALQASETRYRGYRSLVEHSIFGVYIIQGEKLVYVNPKGAELLGYTADELLEMPSVFELLSPADGDHVREQFERIRRGLPTVHFVARANHKDGSSVPGEVNCSLAEYEGQPAIIATVMDITDRLQLEEQLRHAHKMEAIGRLAGGIAHDFNNLLTAIRGNAELFYNRIKGDPSLAAEVDEVVQAADRAASLTRQLLAFSRKQDVRAVTIDLNELVDNVARMARRVIGADVQLEIRRGPTLRPVVADPAQMEQVLLNLVLNARDALPEGGHIRVKTANVTLQDASPQAAGTGLPAGRYVLLQVSDDGVGMDQATQARIFEPFFTTKEPGRGTGLGLATVYGNVRQMGGAVTVQSGRNCGTTFSVHLPAATLVESVAPNDSSRQEA